MNEIQQNSIQLSSIKAPSIFQWIAGAPSLIGKIRRLVASAQAKNWTTTAVTLVALMAYLGNMFGLPIDGETVKTLEAAAIAVIGFFTGKQVVNPQKVDADWNALETNTLPTNTLPTSAEETPDGKT